MTHINSIDQDNDPIDWNDGMGTHDGQINSYEYWEGDGTDNNKGRLKELQDVLSADLVEFQSYLGGKDADGNPINAEPGVAILFFITVMLPHMMDVHSAKIEENADQMTTLQHILEGVTDLKDLANQAKTNADPSIYNKFMQIKEELKEKIQNDNGWLKDLNSSTQQAFNDLDTLLDGQGPDALKRIWDEASGNISPFAEGVTIDGNTLIINCPTSDVYNSFKSGAWAAIKAEIGGSMPATYDPTTQTMRVDISSLTPEQKQDLSNLKSSIQDSMHETIVEVDPSAQGGSVVPNDEPLKKLLTAFDTLTTSSNNISTDVQGDMKIETGTYDQFVTLYQKLGDEFVAEMKNMIDKTQ